MRWVASMIGVGWFLCLAACESPTEPSPLCSYTVSPAAQSVSSAGGALSSQATRTSGTCQWSAASTVPWITLTAASGSTSGSVAFSVATNNGDARSGTISVSWTGGTGTVAVSQEAAPTVIVSPPVVGGS